MKLRLSLVLLTPLAGCSPSQPDDVAETTSALSSYSPTRGQALAARALALWNGHSSRNLCLAGVGDTLESSGVVSPPFPRLPSAVDFDNWARANPAEMAKRGFEKQSLDVNHIPRGSIITWRPGQCGYSGQYGHIEIVADTASSRACSDFCGSIRKSCGAPGIYVPIGGGSTGSACSVQADAKLHCRNKAAAPLRAAPTNGSAIVNRLRTTNSWFDCWTTGDRHAGGNTTWYHTIGDDNGNAGFVAAVDLSTPDTLDANPSAAPLAKCP